MELHELEKNQSVNIQIVWGEKVIGFHTQVMGHGDGGVYVAPYAVKGQKLELNVKMSSNILCHVYADDIKTGRRVSWKNVELMTIYKKADMFYQIHTAAFNALSHQDDRRAHGRMRVDQVGMVVDYIGTRTKIMIYDISEHGISFLAPKGFVPSPKLMYVSFSPMMKKTKFAITVPCRLVHSSERQGNLFCGCEITEDVHEFLLYGSMLRMQRNEQERKRAEAEEAKKKAEEKKK